MDTPDESACPISKARDVGAAKKRKVSAPDRPEFRASAGELVLEEACLSYGGGFDSRRLHL